jgi:hypothetical protein
VRPIGVVISAPGIEHSAACDSDRNRVSLSSSSRKPPMKDSANAFCSQHAVSTAAALFRHLDFSRSCAGRPIVGDDLL